MLVILDTFVAGTMKHSVTRAMRFSILAALERSMLIFRIATPSELIGRCQRFGKKHTISVFRAENGGLIFEMFMSTYKSTRHYSQDNQHRFPSHILALFLVCIEVS
jgi:hypothetical protein